MGDPPPDVSAGAEGGGSGGGGGSRGGGRGGGRDGGREERGKKPLVNKVKRFKNVCTYCRRPGHYAPQCPVRLETECFNCGEKGHKAMMCEKGVRCFHCGEYGHRLDECQCTEVRPPVSKRKRATGETSASSEPVECSSVSGAGLTASQSTRHASYASAAASSSERVRALMFRASLARPAWTTQ